MDKVTLGKVVKLFGYKGEMKIATKLDSDFDLKKIDKLIGEDDLVYDVTRIFKTNDGVIAGLAGVDLTQAKLFVGKNFYIDRSILKNRILIEDIKGSKVQVAESIIGTAIDVQDFGAAEVIYVKLNNGNEMLLPNANGVIESFDLASKTLVLNKDRLQEVADYEV